MNLIIILGFFPNLLLGLATRWDLINSIRNIENNGLNGTWSDSIFCPNETWVQDIKLFSKQNTGINDFDMLGLSCYDILSYRSSVNSPEKEVKFLVLRSSMAFKFMNYFSLSVSNETVVVDIRIGSFEKTNNTENFRFNNFTFCPTETAVCGAKPKFKVLPGDINGPINDIEFHCCRYCETYLSRYIEIETKICRPCYYKCRTFSGGKYNGCLSCFTREILINNQCYLKMVKK